MHEDDFPNVISNYRLLRKEGIKFPKRSKEERYMINFRGIVSPVYASMEGDMPKKKKKKKKKEKK